MSTRARNNGVHFAPVVSLLALSAVALASTANWAVADSRAVSGILDLREMPQTRERPLFTPSRRAPVPARPAPKAAAAPAPAAPPPPEPDQLVLTGIVSGQGTQLAVLRNARTNEVHRLQRGEKLLGWSVDEIATRSVVLNRDGKALRLELFPEIKR